MITLKLATNMSQVDGFAFTGVKVQMASTVIKGEVISETTSKKLKTNSYPNLFTVTVNEQGILVGKIGVVIKDKSLNNVDHDDAAEFYVYGNGKLIEKQKALCHFNVGDGVAEGQDLEFSQCKDIEVVLKATEEGQNQFIMLVNAYSKAGRKLLGTDSIETKVDRILGTSCGYCDSQQFVKAGEGIDKIGTKVLFQSFRNLRVVENDYDFLTIRNRNFNMKTCKFEKN